MWLESSHAPPSPGTWKLVAPLLRLLSPHFQSSLVPRHHGYAATPHASQWFEGDRAPPRDRGRWPSWKTCPGSAWRRHGALDLSEKQLETKTEDICVIRWSKPLGDYIMNFYRPKEVTCKKMESVRHTRCPRGRGACPVRVGEPSTLMDASCPSRTTYYFPIFLNIPKRRKIALWAVFESVYLPYHISIPFWSLKHSGKCPLCIPSGLRFQQY